MYDRPQIKRKVRYAGEFAGADLRGLSWEEERTSLGIALTRTLCWTRGAGLSCPLLNESACLNGQIASPCSTHSIRSAHRETVLATSIGISSRCVGEDMVGEDKSKSEPSAEIQ